MRQLTPRQKQILELIQDFIAEFGMPPTRAEIAKELGFKSANAAEEHLRALQKKGVLDLMPGASRGIQLKDSLRDQLGLPLVGRVAAGSPILAEEHIETHYRVDPAFFNPKPHYLLRVQGMSMKNAVTANQLKTKGVSILDTATSEAREAIITVRGKNKYVVLTIDEYNRLREC